jgi:peptidyl-prolyl cis-trans isomerase SurA
LLLNVSTKKCPDVKEYIDQAYEKFINNAFIQYEDQQLDIKYPDFHNLIQEYHDGILLYDIMDQEVWSKASHDSAGLISFFNQESKKYIWGDRLDASIFYCKSGAIAQKVLDLIKNRGDNKSMYDTISKLVCDSIDGHDCLKTEHKLFSRGDNPDIDSIPWMPQVTKPVCRNHQYMVIKVDGLRKPEPKKLDEVRGLVIADYQNKLEEKWIAELKNRYPVVINKELLNKIANKQNN